MKINIFSPSELIPFEPRRRLGAGFLFLILLFAFPFALADEPDGFVVGPGLTAHWFDPERSGEGLVLEILDADSAVVYWFTYDDDGNQRWLLDVGEIVGDQIVFSELTVTHGGQFGPDFDPDEVEYEVAGEAVLKFSDCNSAEFSYTAFGESATRQMVRLTQTMAAGCQPAHGVPGQPVREYAGQSGSWFDLDHAGEGYTLQWLSHDEAVLIWFTYDPEGNQYWMTGLGRHEDGRIEFETLFTTTGTSFGEAFDADDVEYSEWGSLSLEIECLGGTAQYQSELPEFGSGDFHLTRLSQVARPDCPYQAPSFTDLYEVQITEIDFRPLADDSTAVLRDMNFTAKDIALDGTVAGERIGNQNTQLFVWSPNKGEFYLSERALHRTGVFIRPDASYAIGTQRSDGGTDGSDSFWEPIWAAEGSASWDLIPNIEVDSSIVYGVSQSGLKLVGTGRYSDSESVSWVWDEDKGQSFLSVDPQMAAGVPRAVSDDGEIVVGNQGGVSQGMRTDYATRWVSKDEPEIMRDGEGNALAWSLTCDATCTVVPGSLHGGVPDVEHPDVFKYWIWTEKSGFHYLESDLPHSIDSAIPPSKLAFDTTADGSMFVGRYFAEIDGGRRNRPVIWTQITGVEALQDILSNVEGWDDNWGDVQAVAVSTDGRRVLLTGDYLVPPEQTLGRHGRAIVLELIPR